MAQVVPVRPIVQDLRSAVARTIAKGAAGIGREFAVFAAGMEIGRKSDLSKAHRDVARTMRDAVKDAYQKKVVSVRKVGSYERYGRNSGALQAAINRSDLAEGNSEGIAFINRESMDKEASHWKRLNFGAGSIAGPQVPARPLRIFGQTIGRVGLRGQARPAFSLPPGFFQEGITTMTPRAEYRGQGSVHAFYPNRKSPYQAAVTAGIRGRHFLEAGIDALRTNLPLRYEDLMRQWLAGGGGRAGQKVRQLNVGTV